MMSAVGRQPPHSPAEAADKAKVKILLVDDTPENLVALEAALETLEEHLVLARSGREALRCLLEDEFAAILLDVKMPDMDGFETAELIRNRPRCRNTPILFLTGYKSEEHLFRGYDLGAVDFLFKPIVPEILRSKVAVFVELSRQSALLRQQTDALRKQEQQFRSLLEAAPDAMVISRQSGEIVLVNSRAESLFGYPRRELLQSSIQRLVPDWKAEAAINGAQEAREERASHQSGREFPAELTLSPLQTEEGLLITTAIRDVTERKKVEETIRGMNTELEERVARRTAELRQYTEELEQFAYVASHDLQEPLRMVASYTQLLERRYRDTFAPDAHEFMGYIVQGVLRMQSLIDDLLMFSRVSKRQEPNRVESGRSLEEALENLRLRIQETGAEITAETLPQVTADSIQLTQVFQNLIGNALKYHRPGIPPRVRVFAAQDGGMWVFTVEDQGIGIAPHHQERIFGIFKRLHKRHESPGNGIGLAICKRIVERHGGRIWVESHPESGSRFLFSLPA